MALSTTSAHLLALGDCLDGTIQLVSWQDVYVSISGNLYLDEGCPIHLFLADPQSLDYLIHIDQTFQPDSAEAKAAFDRQVSAINAPSSGNGSYDIKQIKEDALWLSKEAGISQIAALRLVVLELQHQPEDCILGDVQSSDNGNASLPFQKSMLLQSVLGRRPAEFSGDLYNTATARHARLLRLLISEQQYVSKCKELIGYTKLSKASPGPLWLRELGSKLAGEWLGKEERNLETALIQVILKIESRIATLRDGFPYLREEEELDMSLAEYWYEASVNEIIHDLTLALHLIQFRNDTFSANGIKTWFEFMDDTSFAQIEALEVRFTPLQLQAVQSLVALISAAILKPERAMATLPELAVEGSTTTPPPGSYVRDPGCVELLTAVMARAAQTATLPAGPAMLAWSIFLYGLRHVAKEASTHRHTVENAQSADSDSESVDSPAQPIHRLKRMSSFGSDTDQPQSLASLIQEAAQRVASDDDISDVLFQSSVRALSVFEIIAQVSSDFCVNYGTEYAGLFGIESRLILFDVLTTTNAYLQVPYDQDLIGAMLAVLGAGQDAAGRQEQYAMYSEVHPARVLMHNKNYKRQFLDVARSRFPWEYAPFLALSQYLAPVKSAGSAQLSPLILDYVRDLSTITTILKGGESNWNLSDDDQGYLDLNTELDVLPNVLDPDTFKSLRKSQRILGTQADSQNPYLLPPGTRGQPLNQERPLIVMWDYQYSGLAFLGLMLQLASGFWLNEKAGRLHEKHTTIVVESLAFLASVLESSDEAEAVELLGKCSEDLSNSADIIQVVFDIFESLLYRPVVDDTLSGLLVACVGVVRQFVRVTPGRVWPFIGRSGLLGIDKTDRRFRVIIASHEIPTGQFAFLLSTVRLFDALVEDSVTNCLKRKSTSRAVRRFQPNQPGPGGLGVTESTENRILGQFQAQLLDVFESSQNWRFQKIYEKTQITATLLRAMDKILVYYNDADETSHANKKITAFLSSSFTHISNSFLANSQNNAACQSLFQMLSASVETPISSFVTATAYTWLEQSVAAFALASRLVRLRMSLAQSPGVLEAGLLKLVPTFVKAYAHHVEFKLPVVALLRDLAIAADKLDSPPSLFAHLSTDTARNLLKALGKFGQPYHDVRLGAAIWKLMSAVVSLRQRWFSIVLLTGSTPRDTLKEKKDDRSSKPAGSILSLAIREAADISTLKPEYALNLLEFLACAADFWPWVAEKLREDSATWDTLIQFVVDIRAQPQPQRDSPPQYTAMQVQMAAHILDIAAILVHQSAAGGDNSMAKNLVAKLSHLFEKGASSPEYNSILHTRLERNFNERYEKLGCELAVLKKATFTNSQLGDGFYYDVSFASKLLSFDEAWGTNDQKGFRGELCLANRNLSLVEAQIKLFQSWKSLCTEIASTLTADPSLREQMLRVARDCIQENLQNTLPLEIFQRLSQSRAELTFTILQSVVPHIERSELTEEVLFESWNLVQTSSTDLSLALTGDDANYHRTCMRILFLALQPHQKTQDLSRSRARFSTSFNKPIGIDVTMLEILRIVVARGFQSLVTLLHDDATKIQPSDFALLQAILHTVLASPDIERHHGTILNIFSDAKTPTYASTLFSWSDKLLVDGDPVYGEVAINVLLELSTVVPLAESIVTSGALGQVASSNVARIIQKGAGQFDQPSRLYGIWVKCILPLAVNLLAAIGPLIAADTASFLNQFSGQLAKASACLDTSASHFSGAGPGLITLTMAGEANLLALISSTVLAFKDAGSSAGLIAADIPDLAWDRAEVKRDIEDRLSRRAALRASIIPTDEKEELWLRHQPEDTTLKAESQLEHKIVELLTGALESLGPVEV